MKRMRPMHYELYVDSLFLINFTMNLYLLMLVDHSTLSSAVPWRLLVGALFGAGSYLLLFVIGMALPWKLLLGAAAALLMLPITFSVRGLRSFLKLTEKMLFFSFSMGGVLLLLIRCFRFAEGVLTSASGLMAAGEIFLLFWRRFHAQTRQENAVCQVTLAREGASVKIAALIDSGNALVEPISGKPVSIVEEKVFRSLWGSGGQGYRAIPYHSIGKRHGTLEGYLLPELRVETDGVCKVVHDVYVAVSPEEISSAGTPEAESVKMIINPRVLTEGKRGRPEKRQNERNNDIKSCATGKNAF